MPDFPSSTAVDTLDRQRTVNDLQRQFLSPNFLVNPGFTQAQREPPTGPAAAANLSELLEFPGWFHFGLISAWTGGQGEISRVTGFSANHPMRQPGWLEMEQDQGEVFGITQQIANAHLLRGRRVRVSGVYGTGVAPANRDSLGGISIWLKGGKQSVSSTAVGDWIAGGIGYDKLKFSAALDVKHHIELLPGNLAAYKSEVDLYNRWFDHGEDDGVDHYIKFEGQGAAGDGVVARDAMTLWYLDDQFSGTPLTDGSFELHSEIHDVDSDTKYFEAYIDIPDDVNLFEDDECWIVVMGVDPSDAGSTTATTHLTKLFSLSLEVVLDSASLPARVLHGNLLHQMSQNPWGGGALTPRQLYRYPFFIPGVVPLQVMNTLAATSLNAGPINDGTIRRVVTSSSNRSAYVHIDVSLGASPWEYIASQPTLPPGACITSAGVIVAHTAGAGGYIDPSLFHEPSYIVQADAAIETGKDRNHLVVAFAPGTTVPADANPRFLQVDALRNRMGISWANESVASYPHSPPLADSKQGASSLFFHIGVDDTLDAIELQSGYIQYVYDPRLQYTNGFDITGTP